MPEAVIPLYSFTILDLVLIRVSSFAECDLWSLGAVAFVKESTIIKAANNRTPSVSYVVSE